MNQTKTISARVISHGGKTLDATLIIYREALRFIVDVINREWSSIDGLTTKEVTQVVERYIHQTRNNPSPKYNFTTSFHKFPSYFRRAAISSAFGIVSSYKKNYTNWLKEKHEIEGAGKRFNKKTPVLNIEHKAFPVLYKGNMFKKTSSNQAKIKVLLKK